MIDIHTHILYGVDDGAKNLRMSLELLDEAEKVGFDKVILTSHYMENYFTVGPIKRRRVLAEIGNTKTAQVDLYLGNEILLSDNLIKLIKTRKAVTLNKSRYILFELPFNVKPINLMEMIFEMQSNDYVPILAHPERYSYFYKTPKIYEDLVKKGVLLQVNFGSFGGQYGRKVKLMAEKLLKSNLVHFIATDVHRPKSIYPEIPELVEYLNTLIGKDKVYQLTTINPEKVIKNKEIEIEKFISIKWNCIEKKKMKII